MIISEPSALQQVEERMDRPASNPAGSLAYASLYIFCLSYFIQPADWVPGASDIPFGKVSAGLTLIFFAASAFSRPKLLSGMPGQMKWIALLWLQCALTVPFAYWRGGSFMQVLDFLKAILILIVMVVEVDRLSRLRALIATQVISVTALALGTLRDYSGGRASGTVGLVKNPNDLALTLVVAVPLCACLLLTARRMVAKAFCLIGILLMSYCVLITYSRGGFVALIAVYLMMAIGFGLRERRRAFLIIPLLGAALLVVLLPSGYGQRIESIFRSGMDDGSRAERQYLLHRSIEVTIQHPLVGVGPGNFEIVSGKWLVTHNTYSQFSAEAGIPALILFLIVFWQTQRGLGKLLLLPDQEIAIFARGVRAAILGVMVGCLFSSHAYDFILYFLVGYAGCLQSIAMGFVPDNDVPSLCEPKAPSSPRLNPAARNLLQRG
jgi:O-antigen ligase